MTQMIALLTSYYPNRLSLIRLSLIVNPLWKTSRLTCVRPRTTHFVSSSSHASLPEYRPIWGVEHLEGYAPGGYHPVVLGDVFRNRHRVVDKLGYGGFSTVWVARDSASGRYVALKAGVSQSTMPFREVEILRALFPSPAACSQPGSDCIPCIFDEFDIHGPNGTHRCYTMTLARSALSTATEVGMFSLDVARALAARIALAVAYVHSRGYVHGDLHLGNVLAEMPSSLDKLSLEQFYEKYGQPETAPIARLDDKPLPFGVPASAVLPMTLGIPSKMFTLADTRVLLSDFGESFSPEEGEVRLGEACHCPLSARPPETQHDPDSPFSYPADIWMLALSIWNVIAMKSLFTNTYTTPDNITAQQIDLLGPLPTEWHKNWLSEHSNYFDESGNRKNEKALLWTSFSEALEEGVQKWREKQKAGVLEQTEKVAFLDLIRGMLAYRPEERLTIDKVLESEWMVKWALPELERAEAGKRE